jgi:hypothetical protein
MTEVILPRHRSLSAVVVSGGGGGRVIEIPPLRPSHVVTTRRKYPPYPQWKRTPRVNMATVCGNPQIAHRY